MTTAAWLLVICTIICLCGSVVAVPTLEKFAPPVSGGQSGGLEPIVKGPANVQGVSPLSAQIVGAVKQKPQITAVKMGGPTVQAGQIGSWHPMASSQLQQCLSVTFYGYQLGSTQFTNIRAYGIRNADGTAVAAGTNTAPESINYQGSTGWNAGKTVVAADGSSVTAYFDLIGPLTTGVGTTIGGNKYETSKRFGKRLTTSTAFEDSTSDIAKFSELRFQFWKGTGMSSSVVTVPYTQGYFKVFPGPYIDWISPIQKTNTSTSALINFTFEIGGSGLRNNALVFLVGPDTTSLSRSITRNMTATTVINSFTESIARGGGVVGKNLTTTINLSNTYRGSKLNLGTITPVSATTRWWTNLRLVGRPDSSQSGTETTANWDTGGVAADTALGLAEWNQMSGRSYTAEMDDTEQNRAGNPYSWVGSLPFQAGMYYPVVWNPDTSGGSAGVAGDPHRNYANHGLLTMREGWGASYSANTFVNTSGIYDDVTFKKNTNVRFNLSSSGSITGYSGIQTIRNSTVGNIAVTWTGTGLSSGGNAYLIQSANASNILVNKVNITASSDGTSATTSFDFFNAAAGLYYLKHVFSDGSYASFGSNGANCFQVTQGPHIQTSTPAVVATGTNPFYLTVVGGGFAGTYTTNEATRSFGINLTRSGTTDVKWPLSIGGLTTDVNNPVTSVSASFDTRDWVVGVYNVSLHSMGTVNSGGGGSVAVEKAYLTVSGGNNPILSTILPATGANTTTSQAVTLTGYYLRDGAKVNLTKGSVTIQNSSQTTVSTSSSGLSTLITSFNLSGVQTGTYRVAVTNVDGTATTEAIDFTVSTSTAVTIRLNSPTKVTKAVGAATGYTMKITGTNLKAGSTFSILDVNTAHGNRSKGPWTLPYVNSAGTFIKTEVNAFKPDSTYNSAVYNVTITSTDGTTATRAWGLSITSV